MSEQKRPGVERFWQLSKEEREQIFDGNLEAVGGWATDFDQIALTVYSKVREFYPINAVPRDMESAIEDLRHQCRQAAITFDEIVELLCERVERDRKPKEGAPDV